LIIPERQESWLRFKQSVDCGESGELDQQASILIRDAPHSSRLAEAAIDRAAAVKPPVQNQRNKSMPSSKEPTAGMAVPIEMYALLGPPPILSTESAERFNGIFDQLVACLKPRDHLELMLIRDFAVASWEADRYIGHRSLSFNRCFRQNIEQQVQQLKAQNARRKERVTNFHRQSGERPHDVAALVELERKILESDEEMEALLKRTPSELDLHEAIEKRIALHKDLEFLIASLTKRKNEALEMLERYRKGLGKRVAEALDEILEGEFKEVDAPARLEEAAAPKLIPAEQGDPGTNDVRTENSSEPA
jgi:hypothetical protein